MDENRDAPENVETAELARLGERRQQAVARVDAVEREQRAAHETLHEARLALVEHERSGGSAPRRQKLEEALAEAERGTAQPFAQRIEGARAHLRDVDAEQSRFVAENLRALVATIEADGEIAVADLLAASEAIVAAYARREQVAQRIGALVSLSGARVHPSDVGPSSRAESVAREAARLIQQGEPAPTLRRYPGELGRADVVDDEPVHAVPA